MTTTTELQADQAAAGARARLLAALPVSEHRMELAGIPSAVLEGGAGPPVILLHGPGEYAAKWLCVIPDLVRTHRVVAPDLPGHGTSEVPGGGRLDTDHVLAWLEELIDRTCPAEPPALVGQILGAAIAARYAASRGDRIGHLVLVDALGLAPFRPAPEFGRALMDFLGQPDEETHDRLWRGCAYDLDGLRERLGERWTDIKAYNLDRARALGLRATQQSLMEQLGIPAISPKDLARIAVPTALIWGRHDLATPLAVAEAASARYGWRLLVIGDAGDDPPMERPGAFLHALRAVLGVH